MLDLIGGIIGTLLYPLFASVFTFIDAVQAIFYSFAGIGTAFVGEQFGAARIAEGATITSGNSGEVNDTGLLFYLLNQPVIKNLFFSILVLAIFLIIIFTAMAFIKNTYAEKPKTWQDIVKSSLKGLINFVFVPVCCLLGVWLGNILLRAINSATSSSGSSSMSRKLFIAAAYNANDYRLGNAKGKQHAVDIYESVYGEGSGSWIQDVADDNEAKEYYAQIVDMAYAEDDSTNGANPINIQLWGTADDGYSLWQINYIVLIVGGIFMLYVLGSLAFAMVRRIFILLILFIISPALCAMCPLDDGNAVKSWKEEFKKQVISAYGAVAGMNLFFSILPLVSSISVSYNFNLYGLEVGGIGGSGLLSSVLQLFIIVSGLFCVKELIGLISGYIGAEDAYSKGSSLMKESSKAVKEQRQKAVKKTGAFVGGVRNVGKSIADGAGKHSSFGGKVVGGFLGGLAGTADTLSGALFKVTGTDQLHKDFNEAKIGQEKVKTTELWKAGRKPVTDKKKEDKEKKIAQEEARQSAFSANTDYETSLTAHSRAETNLTNFTSTHNKTSYGTAVTYNADGTVGGIERHSDEEIEKLRLAAESPGISDKTRSRRSKKYTKALEDNRIIREYGEKVKEVKQQEHDVKNYAVALASQIKALAGNYKGKDVDLLNGVAERVRQIGNSTTLTVAQKQAEINNEINNLSAEMKNILNTGSK